MTDRLTAGQVARELGCDHKTAQRAMDEAREQGVGRKDPASGWRSVAPEELDDVAAVLEDRRERNPVVHPEKESSQ